MKSHISIILLMLLSAQAQADDHSFTSFVFENDVFFKDDGLYSNGLFFTWGYNQVNVLDDKILPSWIAYLAAQTHITSQSDKQYAISYSVGQALQTAINIEVETLVEEDAPYVGLLAWEVKLFAYDQFVSDEVGLILGAVGPMTGGDFVQSFVHSLTAARIPQGWDNQINNEFVFRAQARRTWRLYEMNISDVEFDFLAGVDGGLGNLRSDVATGVGFRIGQKLRKNFISSTVFPVQKFNGLNYTPDGWYLFFNASAVYVFNDIFINGNTFHDSHSVELIPLQIAYSAGIMVNINDYSILYTLLSITDEYEGQAEASRFGSIALTYHF